MNKTLENIEDYFCNRLSPEERETFEAWIKEDAQFAKEVAFFISAKATIKEQVLEVKRDEFKAYYQEFSSKRKSLVVTLWPYIGAVAASVILYFGWLLFMQKPDPSFLANQYIQENLETLSVNMDTSIDSLQQGISAYNNKDFGTAGKIFSNLSQQKDKRAEAVKYLGFVYLITGNHDKAILEFDTLSHMHNLYANPGYFYKALALIKRGKKEDVEEARKLLKVVEEKKLPGYKEAEEWKLN